MGLRYDIPIPVSKNGGIHITDYNKHEKLSEITICGYKTKNKSSSKYHK